MVRRSFLEEDRCVPGLEQQPLQTPPAPAGLFTCQRDTEKESSAVTNKTNSIESALSLRSLRNNSLLRKKHHPWDHFEKDFNNKNKTKHKSLLNSRGTLGLGSKGQPSVDRIAVPGSLHSGVSRLRWALSSVGCCSWRVPEYQLQPLRSIQSDLPAANASDDSQTFWPRFTGFCILFCFVFYKKAHFTWGLAYTSIIKQKVLQ